MVIRFLPVRQQWGGTLWPLAVPSSNAKDCSKDKEMRLHSIAMGVMCVLALSACGGGGGGTGTSSSDTPTTGASPSAVATITAQPLSQSAVAGSAVTFTVSATGNAVSYQWQDSANAGLTWTDISGATSTGYTVSSVSGALNGRMYRVGVSSSGGTTVFSSAATLTVAQATAPGISVQPADVSAVAGNAANISVTATGTSLQYQWQVSSDGTTWQNIASATAATLHLASLAVGDSGKHYRVIVSNAQGSMTSNPVLLTVSAPPAVPSITQQPSATSVITGQAATFSVTASGNPAPSYQWQVSTDGGSTYTNIGGAVASSYTLTTTSATDNGKRFRVVVTNSQGSVTSSTSTLTVATGIAPSVTTDPTDTIANYPANDFASRTATFTVQASGTPTPNLQWQVSTDGGTTYTNVNGATSSSYTTPAVGLSDDGKEFRAVVTNAVGSVTSHPARLDVQNIGFGGLAQGMIVRPNGDIVATVNTCLTTSFGCNASDFMGLRVLTHTGSVISLAGSTSGLTGDVDGAGSAATFRAPFGVTQDSAGNLYVSDWGNRIRKVTAAGVVNTLAGGDATGGFVNGSGTQASFYGPGPMASDPSGNLYVFDTKNAAIRKVTPTGVVTTLAGGAQSGTNDGTGALAQFTGNETGLAYDPAGNQLIVSNQYHCTIRKVSLSGVVTTISGVDKCSYADGPLAQATFASPNGVAVDGSGNIFVLDDFRIRKITPAGVVSTISTISGNYISWAIATDTAGNVYALYGTQTTFPYTTSPVFGQSFLVRKVAPDGSVTTLP